MAEQNLFYIKSDVVKSSISTIAAQIVHEHFAGYLGLLEASKRTGSLDIASAEITTFHKMYMESPGGQKGFPYISPFRSKKPHALRAINQNLAGSYAPSSLRPGGLAEVIEVVPGKSAYRLKTDHVNLAREYLLYDKPLPVLALSAFLYRDYGFFAQDNIASVVTEIFKDMFGFTTSSGLGEHNFNNLFFDDKSNFPDENFEQVEQPWQTKTLLTKKFVV